MEWKEPVQNTQNNKFGLVELNSRFGDIQLPEIHIVDIKRAHQKKLMEYHFSPFLIKNIEELPNDLLKKAKEAGNSDLYISKLLNCTPEDLSLKRARANIKPVYKRVDT